MLKRMLMSAVAGVACLVCSAAGVSTNLSDWVSTVADGLFNDPSNWENGIVPYGGGTGVYGRVTATTGDVTFRFPAEGLVESGGLYLYMPPPGAPARTLTFDTRGTRWVKGSPKGTWAADWSAFCVCNSNGAGSHYFNLEGLNTADLPLFEFSDGILTFRTESAKVEATLESGTLNFVNPGGVTGKARLYLGGSGLIDFTIRAESVLTANGIDFRGNSGGNLWFKGGEHRLTGAINVKDANSGTSGVPTVWVESNTVLRVYAVSVAHRCTQKFEGGSKGFFKTKEDAQVLASNTFVGDGTNQSVPSLANWGLLDVADRSGFICSGVLYLGNTQCSTGDVTVVDAARVTTGGDMILGIVSNACGRAAVSNQAVVTVGGSLRLAQGKESRGTMTISDDAVVVVTNNIQIGRGENASGLMSVSGHADVRAGLWLSIGYQAEGAQGLLEMSDDAAITIGGSAELGYGGTTRADVNLSDRARLTIASSVTNKTTAGSAAMITVSDDAVFSAASFYGTGVARLSADGGTLKIRPSVSSAFLGGFDAVVLSDRGLTLDLWSDTVVDQAFTGTGTLRKTGPGLLTASRESSHHETIVTDGALAFAPGVTRFGRTLTLAGRTAFELPADTAVSFERLTLGTSEQDDVTLSSAPGATLSVTEPDGFVMSGRVMVLLPDGWTEEEPLTILSLPEGTPVDLSRFSVRNPETGYAYTFSMESGTDVRLTKTAAEGVARVWTGARDNLWKTAGNWSPEGVPSHNDDVTVRASADSVTITLDGAAAAKTLALSAAGRLMLTGDAPLIVMGKITADAGVNEMAAPLVVPTNSTLAASAGTTVTISGPVSCALPSEKGRFEKTGTGRLVLSGDNSTYSGDWILPRGVTAFVGPTSLGPVSSSPDALVLSNNTFRYSGAPATISRPIRLTGALPAIFDIADDLTLDDFKLTIDQGDNGIVKTGAGTLTLNVPSGNTILSKFTAAYRKGNADPSGVFTPRADGEITDIYWSGLGQMTVLEGRLAVKGKGRKSSYVKQEHHMRLGGSGIKATVPPELWLEDVSYTQGSGSGFHMQMGGDMADGSAAPKMVLINTDFNCNGLNIGQSRVAGNGSVYSPVLALTNAMLNVSWQLEIARSGSGAVPIIRVGPGSVFKRESSTTAGGFILRDRFDMEVADGGLVMVTSPQWLFLCDNVSTNGRMDFVRGGGCKTTRLIGQNAKAGLSPLFDGGRLELTEKNGVSSFRAPDKNGVTVGANGMELIVSAGVTHTVGFPFRGPGRLTKTGAGRCILTNALDYGSSSMTPTAVTPAVVNGVTVGQHLGGTTVAEGTLSIRPGVMAETAEISVNAGAVLDLGGTTDAVRLGAVSGPGVISNGTVTASIAFNPAAPQPPVFTAVNLTGMTVDFGQTETDEPLEIDTLYTVAHFGADVTVTLGLGAWKIHNAGNQVSATFSLTPEGDVQAQLRHGGFILIVR